MNVLRPLEMVSLEAKTERTFEREEMSCDQTLRWFSITLASTREIDIEGERREKKGRNTHS